MYPSNTYDVSLPQDYIQRNNSVAKPGDTRSAQDVPVVVVRNAYKSYYGGKLPVLENFSMTVRKGTIYSLLGSSGCGKTTTLSCIVGVQKLKSGSIFVFGCSPGARDLSGSKIGYMPQEISLYGDFSIAENLNYFGTLCGMDTYLLASQIFYLTNLLGLPPVDRRVGSLSGGQRRRVSFAVALIHEPELLLLDEPTTGVDPLLREKIWDHLISLTRTKKTTILLTTHYIDEAKPSQMVGVMREGRLIAEDSPIHLMEKYNTSSLETVILNLCKERNPPPQAIEYYVNYEVTEKKSNYMKESVRRIKALISKNTVIMLRNIFLLIFTTVIPAVIVSLIGVAVDRDPNSLKVGVVDSDSDFYSCFDPGFAYNVEGECSLEQLGCKFLRHVPQDTIELEPYDTIEDAITAVEHAKTHGFLVIPQDYSNSYYELVVSGGMVDDYVLNNSKIILRLDKTNRYISAVIEKTMYETLATYSKQILSDCGFDPRQVESPLQYMEPIFGNGITLLDSLGPSFGLLCVVFFPMLSASIRFIGEKKQGTLGRSLVSGSKIWEIIVASVVTELVQILAQGGLVLIVLRVMTGRDPVGSVYLCVALILVVGISGMVLGFLLGITLTEEMEAGLLAIAIFFPNYIVTGALWPVQAMPDAMLYISRYLPCTMPVDALRSVYNRGWTFTHPGVWPGFAIICVYIIFIVHTHQYSHYKFTVFSLLNIRKILSQFTMDLVKVRLKSLKDSCSNFGETTARWKSNQSLKVWGKLTQFSDFH